MRAKQTRGFSLLEAIIYIAILAAMLAVVINTLLIIGASYRELKTERLVLAGARDSLERMTREIRNSRMINSGSFGSNPGELNLSSYDEDGNPITLEFYVEDMKLKQRSGGVEVGSLTPEGISVDSLIFRRITATSSEAIRIEMTLSASTGPAVKTENFYGTAVIRSY